MVKSTKINSQHYYLVLFLSFLLMEGSEILKETTINLKVIIRAIDIAFVQKELILEYNKK